MAVPDLDEDIGEPLTEEQRLEHLESISQKRRLIFIGVYSALGLLMIFLIMGFVIQHSRIRDLEVVNASLVAKVEEFSSLAEQTQKIESDMVKFTETMSGDSSRTPAQRFNHIEKKQGQILTVQGNIIETFQAFLLSLSRMVRGSQSWSEDFKLYSEQIKDQNKSLRAKS